MTQEQPDSKRLLSHASKLLACAQSLISNIDVLISKTSTTGRKQVKRPLAAGERNIEGLPKFKTVVKAEEAFLKKLVTNPSTIRGPHVSCSNIPYLSAVFQLACTEEDVTHVFRTFSYSQGGECERVRVDVVAGHGRRWIKVKASALKGFKNELNDYDEDFDESDDKSGEDCTNSNSDEEATGPEIPIYTQAKILLRAAEQNLVHYERPTIEMKFLGADEVDLRILHTLRSMGIVVEARTETKEEIIVSVQPESPAESKVLNSGDRLTVHPNISDDLNLDVTTLITLVTDITHKLNTIPHGALDVPPLQLQQSQEKVDPILPVLHSLLLGRKLFTTRSALRKFLDIVKLLGGPTEWLRARGLIAPGPEADDWLAELDDNELQRQRDVDIRTFNAPFIPPYGRIAVVPDQPSDRFLSMLDKNQDGDTPSLVSKKFQYHHVAVFGTGDKLRATTVTANSWMERALAHQGLRGISLWVHEPRSLVELRVTKFIADQMDK
ncbi:hypothetical protein PhCBS80983_g02129 [Powellomyces hirtus]|uniref:DUF1308 domain-containing protein n=1 Tax=Powellomyces hirtus TaxID=109895 RepID=A0A507E7A2_9FUNG|nr:hypothetical protein PhCBS80983_g02129 [Powellomyces hirtus]